MSGKYDKHRLKDSSGRRYLFKDYSRPEDLLAHAAEIAAAELRQLVWRDTTVEVRAYDWRGRRGTLQPWLDDVAPASLHQLLSTPQLARTVLQEHPFDWVVANHDSHADHVLIPRRLHCGFMSTTSCMYHVDKGQAFKYFPADTLDPTYHPNQSTGREEPLYNTLYRAFGAAWPTAADSAIATILAVDDDAWYRVLASFGSTKFRNQVKEDAFTAGLLDRKSRVGDDFKLLYESLRS